MVRRPPARASLRVIQAIALGLVVWLLVLPRLGDTARVFRLVDDVAPGMLVVGVLLGFAAFAAYAQVTASLLPAGGRPRSGRILGIVISSVAVNRAAPLGMAAGSVVTYRLLRREGVDGSDVAFAMVVQAVGSAILLQALLWSAMVPLVPISGFATGAVVAAAIGLATLGVVVVALWALVFRPALFARALAGVARRLPGSAADRVGAAIDGARARWGHLARDRSRLLGGITWGLANWLFDAASLWVFLVAFGASPSPLWVLVAFGVANVISMIPISPGGLGIVETTIAATLISVGSASAPVFVGVAAYRLVHYWLPIPAGALSYLVLRLTRPGIPAAVPAPDVDLAASV